MTVAIAPASGAFAQSDDTSDAKKSDIDKERKAFFDQIKDQRHALKDQIRDHDNQRKEMPEHERVHDVEASLMFDGVTSGWAIVNGKAIPTEFTLDGKARYGEKQGWSITGTGTVFLGDREITFDLKGFAKNNHVNIKGVSQDDDSVIIHLRGNFAPVAESEDSFAVAFTRTAILDESSDVRIPLVLVGDVKVEPIITVDEPVSEETDFEDNVEELDKMLELLS